MNAQETTLLATINARIERISRLQHDLARDRELLREAATALRHGRPVSEVMAMLQSTVSDLSLIEPGP
jgi:hypothetical protein